MKKKKRYLAVICLCLLSMILTGCNAFFENMANKDIIKVYFYNTSSGLVEAEKIKITHEPDAPSEKKMLAVLEALYKKPQNGNQVSKNLELHIKDASLKERVAYIVFDEEYNSLSAEVQMTNRVSIVYSLTELDFIDAVEFYIGDKPLTTSYGKKVGQVSREDMLISALNTNPATITQTIVLYFPKENEEKLYKEERTINVNGNAPLEEYVIAELVKGPTTKGLLPTIPPDTRIDEIRSQELVCQVDLSYNFKAAQVTGSMQEELIIYSIVNSLTELPDIQKVMFLMDGKKQTEFSTMFDIGGLFERNENIIAK
ncbi:MAG: GerMN domain-containing protein [Cellulosilyticaceae bacterium]